MCVKVTPKPDRPASFWSILIDPKRNNPPPPVKGAGLSDGAVSIVFGLSPKPPPRLRLYSLSMSIHYCNDGGTPTVANTYRGLLADRKRQDIANRRHARPIGTRAILSQQVRDGYRQGWRLVGASRQGYGPTR